MNHLSEEQLILHYYGEEGDTLAVEQHLEGCEECRGVYASLQRVLNDPREKGSSCEGHPSK